MLSAEALDVARQALTHLPDAQRAVIALRDFDGYDASEVCEALGLTEGNQRVLLHRARVPRSGCGPRPPSATARGALERRASCDISPETPACSPLLPGAGRTRDRLPRRRAGRSRPGRRFDEHLAGCDGCSAYLDQMRETIVMVGRLEKSDFPADARAKLMAAFEDWKTERG